MGSGEGEGEGKKEKTSRVETKKGISKALHGIETNRRKPAVRSTSDPSEIRPPHTHTNFPPQRGLSIFSLLRTHHQHTLHTRERKITNNRETEMPLFTFLLCASPSDLMA